MLQFKLATLNDLEAIVDIYNSTIASKMVTADTVPVSVASKIPWFESHNASQKPIWIVVNERDETIAWLSFSSFYGRPAYNSTAELSIYIAPLYRSQGIGKKILAFALSAAQKLGIHTILGFIFAQNLASLKLFQSFGFEEWGHLPHVAQLGDIKCSLKILGKKIN